MGLKAIALSPADRQICRRLLTRCKKADIEVSRKIKRIRKHFELRSCGKAIQKIDREFEALGFSPLGWDELMYPDELFVSMEEEIAEAEGETREELEKLLARVKKLVEKPLQATIDDSFLTWLQEICTTVDWTKELMMNPITGRVEEMSVQARPSLSEAFVDFVDKVNGALAAPDVSEIHAEEKRKRKE